MPERPPVGGSQSNGIIERAVGLVAGQARTLKGSESRRKDIVLVGGVCGILDEQAGTERHRYKDYTGEGSTHRSWRKDHVHASQTSKRKKVGAAVPQECLLAR